MRNPLARADGAVHQCIAVVRKFRAARSFSVAELCNKLRNRAQWKPGMPRFMASLALASLGLCASAPVMSAEMYVGAALDLSEPEANEYFDNFSLFSNASSGHAILAGMRLNSSFSAELSAVNLDAGYENGQDIVQNDQDYRTLGFNARYRLSEFGKTGQGLEMHGIVGFSALTLISDDGFDLGSFNRPEVHYGVGLAQSLNNEWNLGIDLIHYEEVDTMCGLTLTRSLSNK